MPKRNTNPAPTPKPKDRLVRMPEVRMITGLSVSAIYTMMRQGEFPRPVPIGVRAKAWLESDITRWLDDLVKAQRAGGVR